MIKKLLIGVLVIACAGMLFACGNSDENTSEALQETENNEEDVEIEALGTICSLEYAFEQEFLTAEDIRSIGYYYNGGKEWIECECGLCDDEDYTGNKCYEGFKETDYQPIAKNPTELSTATQDKIKQTYIDYIYNVEGIPRDVISIEKESISITYYGSYNGYTAVKLSYGLAQPTISTPTIAGTVFYYPNLNRIMIWRENK